MGTRIASETCRQRRGLVCDSHAYMSTAFLKLAFHRYANGCITVDQLSDHIGVKVGKIGRFEEVFLRSLGQPA